MITEILDYLNNYFITSRESISGMTTTLTLTGNYAVGQYICIDGSKLNDDVYQIESINGSTVKLTQNLKPESTNCIVFGMSVPNSIIRISADISTYAQASSQGIASESQGSRSVSYVDGSSWQSVYKKTLNAYRLAISDKERWGRCGSRMQSKSL